jgi:repressor LexA
VFYDQFIKLCTRRKVKPSLIADEIGLSRSAITNWKNGGVPTDATKRKIAEYFGVSLKYFDDAKAIDYSAPNITEDTVTFPVIGKVAAGYTGLIDINLDPDDAVTVPREYLKGRPQYDYFVVRVKGDSMYPMYMDGDCVLVLRQDTLNRSGEVGVLLYDDDEITLKKVEYVMGEDWLRMIPINPQYKPEMVIGERLEHCRVLGIPKLLIREIEQ